MFIQKLYSIYLYCILSDNCIELSALYRFSLIIKYITMYLFKMFKYNDFHIQNQQIAININLNININ